MPPSEGSDASVKVLSDSPEVRTTVNDLWQPTSNLFYNKRRTDSLVELQSFSATGQQVDGFDRSVLASCRRVYR